MAKYVYDGPVTVFGKCVATRWKGETCAPTKEKAKSNLAYQFKKKANIIPGSKVAFPGDVKCVG